MVRIASLFFLLLPIQAFLLPPSPTVSSSRSSESLLPATSNNNNNNNNDDKALTRTCLSIPAPLAGFAVVVLNVLAPWAFAPSTHALPQKAPETNAQMLLIDALPNKNPILVDMASSLAKVTTEGSGNIRSIDAKGFKGIKPWPEVQRAARGASGLISGRSKDLLKGVKPADEKAAQAVLADLNVRVDALGAAADAQDRAAAVQSQVQALLRLEQLGNLEVAAFPYTPPTNDYPDVPQLLGRAEVEITVSNKKTRETNQMYAILDGYSAPLSAGHFVDLAAKNAFDKTKVVATDESSVTFAADAAKAPKRTVPLEILVEGDKAPSYGETLEEQGRYQARVTLPFNAYGTLAVLHPADDPNGGGLSFFFLKADPSYTPAGLNTLDGAFSVIGYVVSGEEALDDLAAGDSIDTVKVLSGLEVLKVPAGK